MDKVVVRLSQPFLKYTFAHAFLSVQRFFMADKIIREMELANLLLLQIENYIRMRVIHHSTQFLNPLFRPC